MASGFDIGNFINGISDRISSAPIINGIIANPVYTSLLLSAILIIVVMAVYGVPFSKINNKSGARAFGWVLFITSAVLFVHYNAMKFNANKESHNSIINTTFSSIQQSRAMPGASVIPVVPNITGGSFDMPMPTPMPTEPPPVQKFGISTENIFGSEFIA